MENQATWIKQPSKKQVIIVVPVWIVGILCSLLAVTNFFTESLFQGKYFILDGLNIASTLVVITVVKNYLANNKTGAN